MSHRSAEEQSLGAPPPLRFKGAVAAIGAAVGCVERGQLCVNGCGDRWFAGEQSVLWRSADFRRN